MRFLGFLLLVFAVSLLAGCAVEGEKMEYGKVCGLGNDGKMVETSGFLADKGSVFCSNTSGRMECGLKFSGKAGDAEGFNADIAIGSGANTMDELPKGYKPEDIVVRGDDGNKIDLAKEVTITGKLSAYQSTEAPKGIGCFIQAQKIVQK